MPEAAGGSPSPYKRTKAAASYMGLSASYLEKMRVAGTGPPYSKLGAAVIYHVDDLDRHAAERRVTSTSVGV